MIEDQNSWNKTRKLTHKNDSWFKKLLHNDVLPCHSGSLNIIFRSASPHRLDFPENDFTPVFRSLLSLYWNICYAILINLFHKELKQNREDTGRVDNSQTNKRYHCPTNPEVSSIWLPVFRRRGRGLRPSGMTRSVDRHYVKGRFGTECRSRLQGSICETGLLDYHERKFVKWHNTRDPLQSTTTSFHGVTMEMEEIHESSRDVSQFRV